MQLTVWKDKKDVFILTNFQNTIISTKKEKIKIKDDNNDLNISKNIIKYEDNEFKLPYVIKEYIENMGGVDKFDQFSNYYNFDHKSKYFRWYMKIFFLFIEI